MKDKRVVVFRKALKELVESLDATLRLANWDDAESVPEPLRDSASRLSDRLGAADRLAAGIFKGNTADVAQVKALTDAMRRVETAYVAHLKSVSSVPENDGKATRELALTLDEIRSLSPED
jgi:hypothetical protein